MNLIPISINSAEPKEIELLYDIGPELAQRIVAHRDALGPFHKPEDLAQVDGVSLHLAHTLSPHIRWATPNPVHTPIDRNWGAGISGAIFLVIGIHTLYTLITDPYKVMPLRAEPTLIANFRDISSVVFFMLWIGVSICVAAGAISKNRGNRRRLWRSAILFVVAIAGLALVGTVGRAVIDSLYVSSLRAADWFIAGMIFFIFIVIIAPIFVGIIRPQMVHENNVGRFQAYGFFASVVMMILLILLLRIQLTIIGLVIFGFFGVILVVIGGRMLQKGDVLLEARFLVSSTDRIKSETWISWLNTHLPNPTDQIELKYALNQAHPGPRIQTFVNYMIVVLGGWTLVTALGGIVEWLVQNWLDTLFKPV